MNETHKLLLGLILGQLSFLLVLILWSKFNGQRN